VILIILMDVGLTIVFTIFLELAPIDAIVSFVAFLLSSICALALTVGVQCFRPAFEEKGKNMGGNMFITVMLQMVQFMGFIFLMVWLFQEFPTSEVMLYLLLALFIGIQAVVALPVFILGLRKIKRIE
jgi:hypothetical protein